MGETLATIVHMRENREHFSFGNFETGITENEESTRVGNFFLVDCALNFYSVFLESKMDVSHL